MGLQTSFHAPSGRADFLGLRRSRLGGTEIVYDNGLTQRLVWKVAANCGEDILSDALQAAVAAPKVIPSLYEELKKRSIGFEAI